jgi:putative zinc finger protein
MPDEHREWRERLGAYALGQLADDEAATVRAHLDGCAACREEVKSELAPVARRLALASPDELTVAGPPRDLADRVVARVGRERRARRRRRRRATLRLSAAGALAAGALAATAIALWPSGADQPGRPPVRVAPAGEQVAFRGVPRGVEMRATLTPRAWGTAVAVDVEGLPAGARCTVWLVRRDGSRVPAGSFRYVDRSDGSQVVLASSLARADAVAVGLRAGRTVYTAQLR